MRFVRIEHCCSEHVVFPYEYMHVCLLEAPYNFSGSLFNVIIAEINTLQTVEEFSWTEVFVG